MKKGTLLVVNDNRNILTTVRMVAEHTFEKIVCIAGPSGPPAHLRADKPDVVLLDMNFHSGINNDNEGLYWLDEIKRMMSQTAVVLFTDYADIDLAVTGLKRGADDFVVKPFDNARLLQMLTKKSTRSRQKRPKEIWNGDSRLPCNNCEPPWRKWQ